MERINNALAKIVSLKAPTNGPAGELKSPSSEQCSRCGNRGLFMGPKVGDYWELQFCPDCEMGRKASAREQQRAVQKLFGPAAIPALFQKATLADFDKQPPIRKLADAALSDNKGLLLWGTPGTGKTHLAAAILKAKLERGVPGLFIEVPDLLAKIRQSYDGSGPKAHQLLDAACEVEFLVLDDLGAERTTEWVQEQLFRILNSRYNNCRQTVITSNLSEKQLEERIGARTVSRVAGMCEVVKLAGDDRRLKKQEPVGPGPN